MPKQTPVISIIIFFLLSVMLLVPRHVSASTQFMKDYETETKLDAKPNLGKFSKESTQRVSAELVESLTAGYQGLAYLPSNDPIRYYGYGIIPITVQYTASLMNRPVRTAEYVADVLHNTGIVQPAYAQGIGFVGLSPVLQIWKAFRNLTYFLFILVFVVIGFMIMFRKKVSSNTIVTVQEALPKIIITLILITFSYAIAGFVVDLIYLVIFVIMGAFAQFNIITDSQTALNTLFGRNIIGIGISYFTGFTEPAGQTAEAMGQLVAQVVGGILGTVANVVFYLIFVVAIMIAVFRTFIQLVTAYISIIISTIFAPFQLLPNAFPGSDAFKKWIQGLAANAAVFPVACVMVVLGATLTGKSVIGPDGTPVTGNGLASITHSENVGFDNDGGSGFFPPLLWGSGAADGGSVGSARVLIGFGMIMLLPEVIKLVHEAFQYKAPSYAEAATKNAQAGVSGINWAGNKLFGQSQTDKLSKTGLLTRMKYPVPMMKDGSPVINPSTHLPEFRSKTMGGWWPF